VAPSTKKRQPLHCVAVEVRSHGQVVRTSLEYLHPDEPPADVPEAELIKWRIANVLRKFRMTCPNTRRFHVVSIGPVIGFLVEDNKGDLLSV